MKNLIKKISDKVVELDKISKFKQGRITSTTIQKDSSGYFISSFSTNEDGFNKEYFNEDVDRALRNIVDWCRNNTSIEKDQRMDKVDTHNKLVLMLRDEPELYIFRTFHISFQENHLDKYVGYFETDNDSSHSATKKNITGVNITYDPVWDSFDATCNYVCENPQNIYSNIETLEEYAETLAENSKKSKSEILKKSNYNMHYHPSNKEILENIKRDFKRQTISSIDVAPDSIVEPTKIRLNKDYTHLEISAVYSYNSISDQL